MFAESLSDYEISIPVRVNSAGEFISHSLRHTVPSLSSQRRRRRRRSVTSSVDYSLQVAGNQLHLALQPSYDLLGPGLVFEHRQSAAGRSNLTDSTRLSSNVDGRLCHFQGTVRGHSGSKVAISTCNGLVSHTTTSTTVGFCRTGLLSKSYSRFYRVLKKEPLVLWLWN